MTEPTNPGDEPRAPHSGLMKQAVANYVKEIEVLAKLSALHKEDNRNVGIAKRSVDAARFWVAEWAGVPTNFVNHTVVDVLDERIDIYFGGPVRPIDPENHLHAHYIFDRECELKQRRERNHVRRKSTAR